MAGWQMTDDEKFLWKGKYEDEAGDNLQHYHQLAMENARDIIACGFARPSTFIFSDLDYVGTMYPNIVRIWKSITYNTAKGAFGFVGESNIGQSAFPAIQARARKPARPRARPTACHRTACVMVPWDTERHAWGPGRARQRRASPVTAPHAGLSDFFLAAPSFPRETTPHAVPGRAERPP